MANAIVVKDLHISYKSLKSFSVKKAFLSFGKNKADVFEAVRGVSFSIEEGSIVGIIGKNGSGKSTLLRSIAGIFSADSGSIETFGHTLSLLSIGVGFQKNLSGKENIYLSGLLLGFTEKQIENKMEDIVTFSGLKDFINKPVRTYSSGMYSKLAFSITAVLEPEIMLIDEVLSVGDEKFQKKSYNKMKELISDTKRTVVIVSHNLNTVKKLCDHVIWLHEGKIKMEGDPVSVIQEYKAFMV